VKILIDENLSPRLCSLLERDFEQVCHVRDVGLKQADDSLIWTYAQEHGFVIVSKDSDFADRAILFKAPPKVIWLRLGNCSALAVAELILSSLTTIKEFEEDALSSFCALPPGLQI
jgi:predicted nuclease of predicted toxin-antitoxin system